MAEFLMTVDQANMLIGADALTWGTPVSGLVNLDDIDAETRALMDAGVARMNIFIDAYQCLIRGMVEATIPDLIAQGLAEYRLEPTEKGLEMARQVVDG